MLGRRTRAMRALLLVVFTALVLRLFAVQELSHRHYAALSSSELTQTVAVPALRGGIYDRNGEVLSMSVVKQTVVADPFLIKDPAAVAAALAPVLEVPSSALRSELTLHSGFVYLAHRVPASVVAKVVALKLPGINLIPEPQQIQPAGQLATPVVGVVGTAGTGLSGLEYQYQSLLAGTPGSTNLLQAPGGAVLGKTGSGTGAAKPGTGLELTIAESVQFVAEQALGAEIAASHAQGGTAVIMDVKTGDILAMANLQRTSPSAGSSTATTSIGTGGTATGAAGGAVSPLSSGPSLVTQADTLPAGVVEASSNSAVTQVYEPGSVFKLVTFSSALTHGVVTPNQVFTVPGTLPLGGFLFHDAEAHGTIQMTATDILAQSSNIGTIEIATALGEQHLLTQIGRLGFGKPTGLNFPGESSGLVLGANRWTGSSMGSTPIGEDDGVTALQILDAYNAVANGGVFVPPRLVRGLVRPNGSVVAVPSLAPHRVISPQVVAQLVPMFEQVVKVGTGTNAAINGYAVAGKTGTSQIPSSNHVGYVPGAFYGTFVGFAPAQHPVFSAVVMLDHPTPVYGGAVAAPVFSTIMEYALHHFGIPTTIAGAASVSNGAVGGTGSTKVTPNVTTEGP